MLVYEGMHVVCIVILILVRKVHYIFLLNVTCFQKYSSYKVTKECGCGTKGNAQISFTSMT